MDSDMGMGLYGGGRSQSSYVDTSFRDSVYMNQVNRFLERKVRLVPVYFDRVDWDNTSL